MNAQHSLVEMCEVEKDLLQARSESAKVAGQVSSLKPTESLNFAPDIERACPICNRKLTVRQSLTVRCLQLIRSAHQLRLVVLVLVMVDEEAPAGRMEHTSARAKQAALTQQLVEMLAAAERENVEMRRGLGQQPQHMHSACACRCRCRTCT